MKALEILKHKWIAGNVIYDEDTGRHTRYLKYDDRLIEEAIKELEELIEKDKSKNCEESYDKTKLAIKALENRSCSNCKHWELGWCFKLGSSLDIGGSGDYWEQK